jgi:phosphatidate cytidylyltransferase
MLQQRLTTAGIGIPIIVIVTIIGGILFTAVVAVILAIAAIEFVRMVDPESAAGRPIWQPSPEAVAAIIAVVLIAAGADKGTDYWTGALVASVGLGFLYILTLSTIPEALADWLTIVATSFYLGFLGSFLILVRDFEHGAQWLLLAVLATWIIDTCAYAAGKAYGSSQMAPRISPNKTWEGTAAGVLGGAFAVPLLNWPLDLPMSTAEAILLGLLLPPVAIIADLGESMLKRGVGIKDTSELVPGHGGFLDRLDSILFTVPLVFYFAVWAVF